uniref:Leucine-rich repeat-containing N-terminal plant-type domain-containing protein n=1 Tax=Triticum urartu TaxID=4572 RepID=A0A8R7U092_TRIUA
MLAMADDTNFLLLVLLLSSSSLCFGSEADIQCLKSVQQSVIDPNGVLKSTWNFENPNPTDGYICRFTGVECWHPDENRVLSLRLGNLGLESTFPQGLQNCSSMIGLDLSNNNFSGPIPSEIAREVPYLTSLDLLYNSFSGSIPQNISNMTSMSGLDLSSNNFSGSIPSSIAHQIPYVTSLNLSYNNFSSEIPESMANLAYLNMVNLQHNQLGGQIPEHFSMLGRLTSFNVADNLLSGHIPTFAQDFSPLNFAGNRDLCGAPLDECPRSRRWMLVPIKLRRINEESSIGAAVGFVLGFVVAFYF